MDASVVIPAYNSEKYIKETLISLLEQDYQDIEIIVVDDGSTDKTADIVAEMMVAYPVIRYKKIENSGGPAKPRNVGLKMARGDVIFLFDSDDIALKGKISTAMDVFKSDHSVGMICTNFSMVDSHATETIRHRMIDDYYTLQGVLGKKITDNAYFIPSSDAFSAIIKTNFVGTSSVAIKKEVLSEIGYFNETFRHIDDREMWFRAIYNTNIAYIEEPYHLYRNHPDGISNKRCTLQARERIVAAKALIKLPKSKQAEINLNDLISRNYYDIGMDALQTDDSLLSKLKLFALSYRYKPTANAIKGIVKVLIGRRS